MQEIRVVMAGMPRMLRDIVSALVRDQPDMLIVAESETTDDLYALTRFTRADVLILGADDYDLPPLGRELVHRAPHLKLLAVGAEGRHVWLYELRPFEQFIGEISPQDLVSAIRDAMRTPAIPMEITGERPAAAPRAGERRR